MRKSPKIETDPTKLAKIGFCKKNVLGKNKNLQNLIDKIFSRCKK